MAKNEQDIIELFVRHNIRFCDFLIVSDNDSTDQTRNILHALTKEFPNLLVLDKFSGGYNQGEYTTNALRSLQEVFFADVLIPLDVDEFIGSKTRAEFDEWLSQIPNGSVGAVNWKTFLPEPSKSDNPFPHQIGRVRKAEKPQYRKAILRCDGALINNVIIKQGNHRMFWEDGTKVHSVNLDRPFYQHIPIRNSDQLTSKAVIGWAANARNTSSDKKRGHAKQWKKIYEKLTSGEGETLNHDEIAQEAACYLQDDETAPFQETTEAATPIIFGETTLSTGQSRSSIATIAEELLKLSSDAQIGPEAKILDTVVRLQPASKVGAAKFDGSFDNNWHWKNLLVDYAPFKFLADRYAPKSVLDVGCGSGIYLKLLESMTNCEILGLDGISLDGTVLTESDYRLCNLEEHQDIDQWYDLAMCLEVLEHLPTDKTDASLDILESSGAHRIVFSAAEPKQPGRRHINCQPIEYWLEKWAVRGWYPNIVDTFAFRASSNFSWFRRNVLILEKTEPIPGSEEALIEIGNKPFVHPHQERGIFATSFMNPYPPDKRGYDKSLNLSPT